MPFSLSARPSSVSDPFPWRPARPSPLSRSMLAADAADDGDSTPSSTRSSTPRATSPLGPLTPPFEAAALQLPAPATSSLLPAPGRAAEALRGTAGLRTDPRYVEQMAWTAIRRDFSGRYGETFTVCITNADIGTWQDMLSALRHSSYKPQFFRRAFGLMRDIGELREWLARDGWPRQVARARVAVSLMEGLQLVCRLRDEHRIDFEFDPQHVYTRSRFDALATFAETLATVLNRPVSVAHAEAKLYEVAGADDGRLQWSPRSA